MKCGGQEAKAKAECKVTNKVMDGLGKVTNKLILHVTFSYIYYIFSTFLHFSIFSKFFYIFLHFLLFLCIFYIVTVSSLIETRCEL